LINAKLNQIRAGFTRARGGGEPVRSSTEGDFDDDIPF